MQIIDLLSPDRVQVGVAARSKKRLLEVAAEKLGNSDIGVDARSIYASLCAREKIGSTGLGYGVAIPHGRLAEAREPAGVFLRLREPLGFDAPDGQPVDLIFAMVVPDSFNDQHLVLLAQLAGLFEDSDTRAQLRSVQDPAELFAVIENWQK